MKYVSVVFIFMIAFSALNGQNITATDLIKRSIKYHDPENVLFNNGIAMQFTGTRPGGEDSKSSIAFNIKKETFQMTNKRDETTINSVYKKGKVTILVDGEKDFSEEVKKKYRLDEKRVVMMKNYYQYLWLMPMKLNDPGTNIDPEVKKDDFFGKESLAIRVTYSEEVGEDIWYFYFNPKTYAMQGYRFYHDEAKNDGEYIILDDETSYKGVRLPKRRTWYMHTDDKLLGTDTLESIDF